MFTGIAFDRFSVTVNLRADDILELSINLGDYGEGIEVGASLSVSGVCLTVVEANGGRVRVEVAGETARITNLSSLKSGDYVNIERSFRIGQEVGGHLLSGHVADVAEVTRLRKSSSEVQLEFCTPLHWRLYLMPKGFVALNGCSLTLAEYDRESGLGLVNLIPETLRRTTFDRIQVGDQMNLEVDSQTQTIVETVIAVMRDESLLKNIRQKTH